MVKNIFYHLFHIVNKLWPLILNLTKSTDMSQLTLENNEFLRQFEVVANGSMARIEYAEQERKIFLTKLIVPEDIDSAAFKDEFIRTVLDFVAEKNMRVVPTSPEIAGFLRKNKSYKDLLPVGIKL